MTPEEKANLENYVPMSKHGGVVWHTPITNAAQFLHDVGGLGEPPGQIWVVDAGIAAGLETRNAELLATMETIRHIALNAEKYDHSLIEQIYQIARAAIAKATA